MRALAFGCACLAGVAAASAQDQAPAALPSVPWVAVPPDEHHAYDQRTIVNGIDACGPVSILNLLQNGPPGFRRAFAGLTGSSAQDKFDALLKATGGLPSVLKPGSSVFDASEGLISWDELKMVNTVLAGEHVEPLQIRGTQQRAGEDPRQLLLRVHRQMRESLQAGVPLLTDIHLLVAEGRGAKGPGWRSVVGHYILVFAVPASLEPFQEGFTIRYLDPSAGIQEGFLHLASDGDEKHRQPYLDLDAPGFRPLLPAPLPWNARRFVAVTSVIGDFPKTVKVWSWQPQDMSETLTTIDIPLDRQALTAGQTHFVFEYSGGLHRLEIASLALVVNGVVGSKDEHPGKTGAFDEANDYALDIPAVPVDATVVLRAAVRSEGGTDSHGELFISP